MSHRMPKKSALRGVEIGNGNGGNDNGGNGNGGNLTSEIEDLDPTENFPQWSKTILLLLDYAMIEGIRRGLHMFVHLLDSARIELHAQVARSLEEMDKLPADMDRPEETNKATRARRRRTVS